MMADSSLADFGRPASVQALMWEALKGAMVPSSLVPLDPDSDDLAESLPCLWDAVWKAASGGEPDLASVSPTLPAPELLAIVRRSFLGLVGSIDAPVDLTQVLRVLQAIERVDDALRRDRRRVPRTIPDLGAFGTVAELAHDLRSPLTSIMFLVDTLRRGQSGAVNDMQQHQLALIYSAAFTLNSMADDLTALARGADKLMDPGPTPFSIAAIVRSTLDVVQPVADQKQLEIRLSLPERDFRVGRPVALGRVLLNLIGNALKFTSEGFVEVAATEISETAVRFSVSDTGSGLPDEVIAILRSRDFTRRSRSEGVPPNVGLGLLICRRLTANLGTDLQVDRPEDGGTRIQFDIELPHAL